jgi:hypothetical protein
MVDCVGGEANVGIIVALSREERYMHDERRRLKGD